MSAVANERIIPVKAGQGAYDIVIRPGMLDAVGEHLHQVTSVALAVIVADAETTASELSEALRGRPSLLVIDGVDRLGRAARDQLAARLRDADPALAVVLTALSPEPALAVLESAERPAPSLIELDAPAERRGPLSDTSTDRGVNEEQGRRHEPASEPTTTTEVHA